MKLSMWIIADWLKQYNPTVKIVNGYQALRNVRLLTPNAKIEKQNVYVALTGDFIDGKVGIVCVHEQDWIFLMTEDTNQIFNELLAAFDYYNDWSDGLKEKIVKGCSLQNIIDDSISIFQEPLIILDNSYMLISASKEYGTEKIEDGFETSVNGKSIPLENVNKIIPILMTTKKSSEPYFMDKSIFPFSSVCRNLFSYKRLKGYITLIHVNKVSTKGKIQLFNELADIIEYWLRFNEDQKELNDDNAIFLDLIEGNSVLPVVIQHKQDLLGWAASDEKVLIKISNAEEISKALVINLESMLKSCVILEYKKSVIIIANLNIKNLKVLLDELKPYLKKSSTYAGLSYPFKDLTLLRLSYNQADIALQYGKKELGKVYNCKDYAMLYGLNAIKTMNNIDLCHPGLDRLLEYDQLNNSEFYETLKLYLWNERNQLLTSSQLHIHRNSLAYRVKRIEEIIEDSLDQADVRMYLIFSYLLKEKG